MSKKKDLSRFDSLVNDAGDDNKKELKPVEKDEIKVNEQVLKRKGRKNLPEYRMFQMREAIHAKYKELADERDYNYTGRLIHFALEKYLFEEGKLTKEESVFLFPDEK
ncbi:hypothetical protein [Chondrinema litorale]|uniref:hypothetical protein n=1 Tax=Chondrinema litorale TaxID=2994555 RepID=UPI000C5CE0A0|nr:hypothetical protein [Chondrinema litorale]MBT29863.1 hypothetical protein [Thalassovita sp.]UZR99988.1 hypothetical protein OQ292_39090 [Chondrinema litorale]|tara:strand:+ start:87 stop:410 length:324 start_codon:yes stop_codon:yes gene_type:complete